MTKVQAASVLGPAVYAGSVLTDTGTYFLSSETPFELTDVLFSGRTPIDVQISAGISSASVSVSAISGGSATTGGPRVFAAAAGTSLEVMIVRTGGGPLDRTVPLNILVMGSTSCVGLGSAIARVRIRAATFNSGCPDSFLVGLTALLTPDVRESLQFSTTGALAVDANPLIVMESSATSRLTTILSLAPAYQDRYALLISDETPLPDVNVPEPRSWTLMLIAILLLWKFDGSFRTTGFLSYQRL